MTTYFQRTYARLVNFFDHGIQLSSESCEGDDRMCFVNIYFEMTDERFCLILITYWPFNVVLTVSFLHLSHDLDFREMCNGETMKGRDCYYEESQ